MLIDDGTWVTVRYRLYDSQGEAIEPGERELTFSTSLYLQPEDSFGDYEVDLVRLLPRDVFPDELQVGMHFEGIPGEASDAQDEQRIFIVTDMADGMVVLDGNHPLAGMALRFE
ncbi:MAG: peptidylprolyl isomerase, partial [Quisquiliibacterium sp.]